MYESGSEIYDRYDQAKENKWKCEKCDNRFTTVKKLKQHKIEFHSYQMRISSRVYIFNFSNIIAYP